MTVVLEFESSDADKPNNTFYCPDSKRLRGSVSKQKLESLPPPIAALPMHRVGLVLAGLCLLLESGHGFLTTTASSAPTPGLKAQPKNPLLFQINTVSGGSLPPPLGAGFSMAHGVDADPPFAQRVICGELSKELGRPATLDDVPEATLEVCDPPSCCGLYTLCRALST